MQQLRTALCSITIGVIAPLILLAGCGSSDDDGSAVTEAAPMDDVTTTETAAPSDAAANDDEQAEGNDAPAGADDSADGNGELDEGGTPEPLELPEIDRAALETISVPVAGGVTFGVEPGWSIFHDNNYVAIRPNFDPDRGRTLPSVVVALVQNDSSGAPGATVADLIEVGALGTVDPTRERLAVGDLMLDGYSFTLAEGLPPAPHFLYPAAGAGALTPAFWQPFPLGELYMTDTPAGVLVVGYTGIDEGDLATAEAMFETVAATLELTSDTVSNEMVFVDRFPVGVLVEALPATPDADLAPVLRNAASPIEPGLHQLLSMGRAVQVEVGEGWWVQVNFPGLVVLTANDSFGPNDRAIEYRLGVEEIFPATTGPSPAGPPVDFTDLAGFAQAPPEGLVASEPLEISLGGTPAIRVDINVDPAADCVDVACHWVAPTTVAGPAPVELHRLLNYRFWQISTGEDSILVVASSPDAEWLDTATAVVESTILSDKD